MVNLSGESRIQNHKDKVTRFRSVTYARQLELLVNTLGSHLKANQHNEFNTRGLLFIFKRRFIFQFFIETSG